MRKIVLLILVAVILSGWQTGIFAADKAGDVVSVRGTAFVERLEKEIKAEKRLALLEKDNISTRENSRVKMLFRDDSILTLGPMSRLAVSQYIYSPEDKRVESIYELLDGKLRAVVGNADFSVKTPTAFAAARGTIFLIWYDPATNSTGIAVLEGKVLVKNSDSSVAGEQELSAGEMTTVTGSSPPSFPEAFQITNQTGSTTGTDIGPIVYEVTVEGVPEIDFTDTRKGAPPPLSPKVQLADDDEADLRNFFDVWPRIIGGDTYRPAPQGTVGDSTTPVSIVLEFQ
ncbi:MAG: FecR family protein [Proteobacteria bacterium]|nr:FecR family protein [Pseudomonadota bacterium]MBU1709436.1 FecR family protein [Pseudomonadota bacterium]